TRSSALGARSGRRRPSDVTRRLGRSRKVSQKVRCPRGRRPRSGRDTGHSTRPEPYGLGDPWPRAILRATIVCGLGFAWTWFFWFKPARSWPVMKDAIFSIERAFSLVPITGSLAWAFRSYVFVLV